MGCANCPKNSINQGLVIISEPSFSDDSDGLKVYSMDKTKVSTLNKNGENKDQMCSISSKNSLLTSGLLFNKRDNLDLRVAKLGNDAGVVGASCL